MKINFHKVFLLIIVSCILGFVTNVLNPDGIDFIRKERILTFEADSVLFHSVDSSSKINPTDSSLSKIEIPGLKKNKNTTTKTEENESKKNTTNKITEVENSVKIENEFTEPKTITLEQAYRLYKQGIVFIDARESEEFANGHILNSVSIPFYEFEPNEYKLKTIKKDQPVVVYCAGTECDLSILLGDQLFESGYKKTYIFFGGWNEWLEAGYPVTSAKKNNSTEVDSSG